MKYHRLIVAALTILICCSACRLGANEETTIPQTEPTTENMTMPTIINPTIMDPLETNIPDPEVDDEHLIDPTVEGTTDTVTPKIRKRIN